jgi:hypothetical protein
MCDRARILQACEEISTRKDGAAMELSIKSLDTPDDERSFEHGTLSIVNLPGVTVARATFAPGWRWSTDLRPLVGTESCQVSHTGVVLSGSFHVRMDDGTELDLGPGDAHTVPAGHDAWVVGEDPCTIVDVAIAVAEPQVAS